MAISVAWFVSVLNGYEYYMVFSFVAVNNLRGVFLIKQAKSQTLWV